MILIISSGVGKLSFGLVDFKNLSVCDYSSLGLARDNSEMLPELISSVFSCCNIDIATLDGFGIDVGPGSFIGVRTGISYVFGLSFFSKKSVFCFNNFNVLKFIFLCNIYDFFEPSKADVSAFNLKKECVQDIELNNNFDELFYPDFNFLNSLAVSDFVSDISLNENHFLTTDIATTLINTIFLISWKKGAYFFSKVSLKDGDFVFEDGVVEVENLFNIFGVDANYVFESSCEDYIKNSDKSYLFDDTFVRNKIKFYSLDSMAFSKYLLFCFHVQSLIKDSKEYASKQHIFENFLSLFGVVFSDELISKDGFIEPYYIAKPSIN